MNYLDRLENRIDLAKSAPLPKPLALYIEPTNICNFHCEFCVQSAPDYFEKAGYKQHISMDLYRKVIADAKAMGGIQSVKLYFLGEPTIHPELGELCRLAGEISDDVQVTTNGTRLSAEKAQGLIDAELDYLRVSIYGDTPPKKQTEIFDNIFRLRYLRDTQGKAKPRIVVKWMVEEMSEYVRREYEGVADELIYQCIHNMANTFVSAKSLTGPQIACPFPFYTMLVKANGDVACCCVAWDKTLNIGNVADESLTEMWAGEKLARIHRLHLEGRRGELSTCKDCDTIFCTKDSVDGLTVEEYNRRCA